MAVTSVQFGPDPMRLVSGGLDQKVIVWDLKVGRPLEHFAPHTAGVLGVALAPDQKTLISAGADQQQWVQTVSALRTSVVGEGKLALFTLAANGAVFATEGPDSTVKLWDANSGAPVREFKGLKEGVKGVAIRADNQQLAAAGGDSQLLLWNLNDAAVQLKYTLASPGGLMSYSADGKKLLVACADKVLRTFNPQVTPPQQGVPPAPLAAVQELKGTAADIHGLAVLADGKQALSVSGDGQLRRWSVASADPVFNLAGHQSFVYAVAFHPSGKMVASASNDKTVKFWDAVAGREIRTLTPQQGPIYSLDFNPQGTLLATGCIDRSVRVFNPENGLELRQLVGAEGAVYSVHFHPNGQTLAVGGAGQKGATVRRPVGSGRRGVFGSQGRHLPRAIQSDGNAAVVGRILGRSADLGSGESRPAGVSHQVARGAVQRCLEPGRTAGAAGIRHGAGLPAGTAGERPLRAPATLRRATRFAATLFAVTVRTERTAKASPGR